MNEQVVPTPAPGSGPAARIVVWTPHPSQDRAFEDGYRRHLDWHRTRRDSWTWHGWTLISGERAGSFIDGTFFHPWVELDQPVSPAEDLADNRINVFPHASLASASAYELVPSASNSPPDALASSLLTFASISVVPGGGSELEARAAKVGLDGRRRALFRPVDGTVSYLMLAPAERTSELPAQAKGLQAWTRAVNAERALVTGLRIETGRYRKDLAYVPGAPAVPPREAAASARMVPTVAGLPPAPGYSYAASVPPGRLVFFAGQVALDERGAVVGKGDFAAQVRRTFENLDIALAAAGCTPADVIKTNYYVVGLDPERLAAIRGIRNAFFPDPKPVSTLVGVTALFNPDVWFELEVVAVRKE